MKYLFSVLAGMALLQATAGLAAEPGVSPRQDVAAPLASGFAAPPPSARPDVWWFWLGGRVSEAGITRDLEAMKDKGFSGATIYDLLAAGTFDWMPRAVELDGLPPEAEFMGDRWRALFRHAVREANRLGLEIGLNLSSGWNCGGTWIKPENGLQRIVWSEREVAGPSVFEEVLPRPDRPPQAPVTGCELRESVPERARRVVAVVAVPMPDGPRDTADAPKPAIAQWREKCCHQEAQDDFTPDLILESTPHPETVPGVSPGAVVDLTSHLDAQGRLTWQVPAGRWWILRFAHVPTGLLKQFSSPGGQGLMLDHMSAQAEVVLDLGDVAQVEEVSLNGRALGTLWKPPFRVELRGAARAGSNLLEIRVTNLWPNRLIGDQLLPREKRFTRTSIESFKKDAPLLPSGLLGPVRVLLAETRESAWR